MCEEVDTSHAISYNVSNPPQRLYRNVRIGFSTLFPEVRLTKVLYLY